MNLCTKFIVKYRGSIQSCFVSLPSPFFQKASAIKGSCPVKLIWDGGTAFVGVSTLKPSDHDAVEISPIFARCLDIPENVFVTVEFKSRYQAIPISPQVLVEPVSADDWEIIASSCNILFNGFRFLIDVTAGYLESEMLNQVDILETNHRFPFWIKNQALIHIRVISACNNGFEFIKLGQHSEVVVNPFKSVISGSEPKTIIDHVRLRVNHCTSCMGVNRVAVQQSVFEQLELAPFALVQLLNGNQLIKAQLVSSDHCAPGHILIPPTLRFRFGVQRFENVVVSRLDEYPTQLDADNMGFIPALIIHNCHHSEISDGHLVDIVVDQDAVLIGPDVVFEDSAGNVWSSCAEDFVFVLGQRHTVLHIKCIGEAKASALIVDTPDQSSKCSAFPKLLEAVAVKLSFHLRMIPDLSSNHPSLKLPQLSFSSGICFTGNTGIGKTFFLSELSRRLLVDANVLAAGFWISCSALASDKADDVKAHFKSVVNSAILKAPSIIVLDDIDSLLPCPNEHDLGSGIRVAQIAEYLVDLFISAKNAYPLIPLTWVASSSTFASIHPALRQAGGFSVEVALPMPDFDERKNLFVDCLKFEEIDCSGVDVDMFASMSDGFVAQDIAKVFQHSVHLAISESSDSGLQLSSSHIESVMKTFTPLLRQGINLNTSEVSWSDIGGLEEVRSTLRETFELPTLYPFLFEQSSLKLRSGILLYGPPGCGKTLIASAVARQCGLNFISVKGPELLNKYIGASEQGVREQFSRAAAAAPSILFFDEFDSLAPRRGADSTGVTDRVVNQMLCHLDGVELRTGVYVLAATSRPDLLDPALLRPGRFDKCLYCGVPDFDARLDILKTISRSLELDVEIDLSSIAERTSNFTGADLQGLFNSAHITAVHEAIEERSTRAVITERHLNEAIQNCHLSVSAAERRRFETIYAAFMGSKPSDFTLQLREGKIGSRTAVK